MTKKQLKQDFINFLKINRAYSSFKRNMKTHSLQELIDIYNISDLIGCAFYWLETEEGERYWAVLSNKWKDYCIRNYNFSVTSWS